MLPITPLLPSIQSSLADPSRALELVLAAWEEFSDLAETPQGVRLMTGGKVPDIDAGCNLAVRWF